MVMILALVFLPSCKLGCDAEKVVSDKLAGAITMGLQCKNVTAIQTDITAILDKTKVCSEEDKRMRGTIANIVCPLVANGAVALLGAQIPAAWECDPAMVKSGLSGIITQYCELLPF